MTRSRVDLFKYLGAPLHNPQWSWGAERSADGALFLVVWQDEDMRQGGKYYSKVHNEEFWGSTTDRPGFNERKRHLERIREGAKVYLIMAFSEKRRTSATHRSIDRVNCDEVFEAGVMIEDEKGNLWIERRARIPIEQARG